MNDLLENFHSATPEVACSSIANSDGLPLISKLTPQIDESDLSALIATIAHVGQRSMRELTPGKCQRVLVEGTSGSMVVAQIDTQVYLGVLMRRNASLGINLFQIKRISETMQQVMEKSNASK